MTARSRHRLASLVSALVLLGLPEATAQDQGVPAGSDLPGFAPAPVGGSGVAPAPGVTPAVPDPAAPVGAGGAAPQPDPGPAAGGAAAPGFTPGFGSLGDFSTELGIQDLLRSTGPSFQPLSISDYRLRPRRSTDRSASFRLREGRDAEAARRAEATDRFALTAPRREEPGPGAALGSPALRLAWPAIAAVCPDGADGAPCRPG